MINRIAQTQPNSPEKPSERSMMRKDRAMYDDSMISIPSMHRATEIDMMSVTSVLKVVNNENDITPPTNNAQGGTGIFATL